MCFGQTRCQNHVLGATLQGPVLHSRFLLRTCHSALQLQSQAGEACGHPTARTRWMVDQIDAIRPKVPFVGDLTLESFPGPNISGLSSTALVSGLGRNKSREKILNESHRNGGIPTRISHTHSGAAPFRFTYPFSVQAVTASRAAVSAQRCIA